MIFKKKRKINLEKIPRHIAFIMDGNGRWAQKRGKTRTVGHQEGARALGRVIEASKKLGVEVVTFYAFSTENWKRPKEEIETLMKMPEEFFKRFKNKIEKEKKDKYDYRIIFIGKRDRLSQKNKDFINQAEEETKDNKGMKVVIAFDYGSREEIRSAVENIIEKGYKKEEITEELISNNLYTKDLPDVDLLIRTSNELRISNFLLWQISYSEIYFESKAWPDMNEEVLKDILVNYQNRDRRYGGLK